MFGGCVVALKSGLRSIWHGLFYALAPQGLAEYAMRCRDVALVTDTDTAPDKLRVYLHLSLCQPCANYVRFSQLLRLRVRQMFADYSIPPQEVEKLNERLLKEFEQRG